MHRYKSKRDYWPMVATALVACGVILIMALNQLWFFVVALLVLFAFVGKYGFGTIYYNINGNILDITFGFNQQVTIDIMTIKKIKKIRSRLNVNSAALSADRIEIFYNNVDSIMLSPEDQTTFVAHLKQINPQICTEITAIQ